MKPDQITADCACGSGARCTCGPVGRVCALSSLGCGGFGRVISLAGAPRLRRRLMALGLRPSADVCVLGRSPHHGPLELRAGGVHLMLREHEADGVLVETHRPPDTVSVPEGARVLPTL